jgi:hypothetical protein
MVDSNTNVLREGRGQYRCQLNYKFIDAFLTFVGHHVPASTRVKASLLHQNLMGIHVFLSW